MKLAEREAKYQKEYRAANLEHLKAAAAARYKANRGPALARAKARATAKREEYLAYQRAYHAANRKRLAEQTRAWQKAHPLTLAQRVKRNELARSPGRALAKRATVTRRRALKAGNGGRHTAAQWRALCEAWEWSCFYCGSPVGEYAAERDHKLPIARGGPDDISNIAVSCSGCNRRKGTRTSEEFLARRAA